MRNGIGLHTIRLTKRKLADFAAYPHSLSTRRKVGAAAVISTAVLSCGGLLAVFDAQAKDNTANANNKTLNSSIKASAQTEPVPASLPAATNSSSLDVNLHSTHISSGDNASNSSSTSLTVNGQAVPVDQSGNVNQHFTSSDGSSNVNISIHNSSSVSGGSESM